MLFANIKFKVKIITILTIINVYQPPPSRYHYFDFVVGLGRQMIWRAILAVE
jgi:hypothetical protein